jgi:S-adenosylmethionine synthetase
VLLHGQSADIAAGVDAKQPTNQEEGAATRASCSATPAARRRAHAGARSTTATRILEDLATARKGKKGDAAKLGPDSKSQVTVRYENGKPVGVTQIVVSHQHIVKDLSSNAVRAIVEPYVRKALPEGWIGKDTLWHVNPTGAFYIGGPDGDTGLTGRKIIVDTYGGAAPHGGGAFSGKDPTKVDRSAAYAARYLAKNVVAPACAIAARSSCPMPSASPSRCRSTSIWRTTRKGRRGQAGEGAGELMDLSPRGIRKHLDLNKPIYAARRPTAISGASRTRTAASPGRRPIWSTS